MEAISRERWHPEFRPNLGTRRGSLACRDMFCTGFSPSSACIGTLFTDFPRAKVSKDEVSCNQGDQLDSQTAEFTRGVLWSDVLELLNPFKSDNTPPPSVAPVTTPDATSFVDGLASKAAVDEPEPSAPLPPTEQSRYFPDMPLVESPIRVSSLFWRWGDESCRYYPELPLVQSPIQVADLGRPVTPLSLDSPSEVWTDSDTLCPSSSSGFGMSAHHRNLEPLMLKGLKLWRGPKGSRRVRSPKSGTGLGSESSSQFRRRWTKPLRKAADFVSRSKRRSGSPKPKLTRPIPRRRDAMWRSPSTQEYSVYFPRPGPFRRATDPPVSPSSVYSQETFHSLFDEDPAENYPADDELDESLELVPATPDPLSSTQNSTWEQSLGGWLDTARQVWRWQDVAYCAGWPVLRLTSLAFRITLVAVPPLTAWAVFRASEVVLQAALPTA